MVLSTLSPTRRLVSWPLETFSGRREAETSHGASRVVHEKPGFQLFTCNRIPLVRRSSAPPSLLPRVHLLVIISSCVFCRDLACSRRLGGQVLIAKLLGAGRGQGSKRCSMASAISCQIASPVGPLAKPLQADAIETTSFQNLEERRDIRMEGRCLINFKDEMKLLSPRFTLAFVYGTLKRGFGNHWLMQEQMAKGHARFVGVASTRSKFPLVCGPFQVPFLLNIPSKGQRVRGEVYEVDDVALGKLDDLEGVGKGHYMRCPIVLSGLHLAPALESLVKDPNVWKTVEFEADAYFADSHYTPGMLDAPHIGAYTEEEAATYVRRKDRPQDKSFLEHVYEWIQARDGNCEVE